jgi:hypothetical protein
MIEYVAADRYTGHHTTEQLVSARAKVRKLKPDKTGGLQYILRLYIGKSYMVTANPNGLVNATTSTLRYIDRNAETRAIKRLWFYFGDSKIGLLQRIKA